MQLVVKPRPEILVLLGDQPIVHYLTKRGGPWRSLAQPSTERGYGRLLEMTIAGVKLQVLPLAHPRQASALGSHSERWRDAHAQWKAQTAPTLV